MSIPGSEAPLIIPVSQAMGTVPGPGWPSLIVFWTKLPPAIERSLSSEGEHSLFGNALTHRRSNFSGLKLIPPPAFIYFFKDFIYLFLESGEGGRKRGRETAMCERNTD